MWLSFITPILKKSTLDKTDVNSYRPISNLSIISKLLERVVCSQLVCNLDANSLMPCNQSAYRRHHWTEFALTVVFGHNSGIGLRRCHATLATWPVYSFRLRRPRHTLAHLRQSYGFDSFVYDWLSSYLRERSQHVCSGGKSTAPKTIKYGVPQGSVLGPLLFVLYTADIGRIIKLHGLSSHFYADDTQTYIFSKPDNVDILCEATVSCIDEVAMWMCANRLRLSQSKTEFVWCMTRRRLQLPDNSSIQLGTNASVRNLGVFIDQSLTMTSHINIVTGRCFRSLRQIRTICHLLVLDAARTLVNSLVMSWTDYCNCILAGLSAHSIARLQSVLNVGSRVIHQRRKYHITDVLRENCTGC